MKRSKKGKPMSWCVKCQKDTVDVEVFNSGMGGKLCRQCSVLKIKPGLSWVLEADDTGRENSVGGGR